jgi:modulator of FtsH protease HflC
MVSKPGMWIAIALIVILSFFSFYTIKETERGIVLVLGRIVEDNGVAKVIQPGLHMKWPFISTVIKFDQRIQTLDIEDSRIVTSEKKDVIVSSFVKWRIKDYAHFYKSTSGIFARADSLLEQKVNDGLRAQFGRSTISEVVSENRDEIMSSLSSEINDSAQSLGIEVIDVRIKRIDLPDEVSVSVFERMRAERQQVAAEHRADGEKVSETIRAQADEQVLILVAKAENEARIIRGNADATVAEMYGKSYSKDPEFYAFYRSLAAYENAFVDKNDVFVLSPESDFFKYFNATK